MVAGTPRQDGAACLETEAADYNQDNAASAPAA